MKFGIIYVFCLGMMFYFLGCGYTEEDIIELGKDKNANELIEIIQNYGKIGKHNLVYQSIKEICRNKLEKGIKFLDNYCQNYLGSSLGQRTIVDTILEAYADNRIKFSNIETLVSLRCSDVLNENALKSIGSLYNAKELSVLITRISQNKFSIIDPIDVFSLFQQDIFRGLTSNDLNLLSVIFTKFLKNAFTYDYYESKIDKILEYSKTIHWMKDPKMKKLCDQYFFYKDEISDLKIKVRDFEFLEGNFSAENSRILDCRREISEIKEQLDNPDYFTLEAYMIGNYGYGSYEIQVPGESNRSILYTNGSSFESKGWFSLIVKKSIGKTKMRIKDEYGGFEQTWNVYEEVDAGNWNKAWDLQKRLDEEKERLKSLQKDFIWLKQKYTQLKSLDLPNRLENSKLKMLEAKKLLNNYLKNEPQLVAKS